MTYARNFARVDVLNADLTRRHGYGVAYKPTRRVRGWPMPSTKPFALYLIHQSGTWSYLASFATLTQLERNFRARAGL